jgi:hypothetical protein
LHENPALRGDGHVEICAGNLFRYPH